MGTPNTAPLDVTETTAAPVANTVLNDELNTGGLAGDGTPGEIAEQTLEGLEEQLHEEEDAAAEDNLLPVDLEEPGM